MMLDATQNYDKPLTKERLFGWHVSLFPIGCSGMRETKVGPWRDDGKGPMQVVSGRVGHERVHFEAPGAARIEQEMTAFLNWFNKDDGTDLLLREAIAHLWFVTIHPFEDGNGRIARALADMMLARSEQSPQRFYSLSAQIRNERDAYYGGLEETQKGTLDGFEGKLTSSKWAKLVNCSQDTALRDILELLEHSILAKDPAGGRSTSYSLIIPIHN